MAEDRMLASWRAEIEARIEAGRLRGYGRQVTLWSSDPPPGPRAAGQPGCSTIPQRRQHERNLSPDRRTFDGGFND
jgi:hypothetical protein